MSYLALTPFSAPKNPSLVAIGARLAVPVALVLALGCGSSDDSGGGTGGVVSATGGSPAMGGTPATGGTATGGTATGGTATGGTATGGTATGGTATGGDGQGGSTAGGGADPGVRPTTVPTGDMAADITAFVQSGAYKNPPWGSETATPREATAGSPHGRVQVWMNDKLADSLRNGRDGLSGNPPPDQWSMAVKELYDASDAMVGLAASFKTTEGTGPSQWAYYCYGPDGRCMSSQGGDLTAETAVFGRGTAVSCGLCHGGFVFTPPPP